MRSRFTACGTWSSSSAASVPRRGEQEGEGTVVAHVVDELEGLREIRLGLARKADDDVGGQRAVRHVLADHRHAIEVPLAVVGVQRIAFSTRLEPDWSGRWMCSQTAASSAWARIVLAHVLRVRARVADALDAVDRVDQREQLGERRPAHPEVAAIAVHVLAEQRDPDAVAGQPIDLRDQLGRVAELSRPRVDGTMQ